MVMPCWRLRRWRMVHYFVAGFGIEIAGWLVGKDEFGLIYEGAGDGDALLLAAGEFVRFVIAAVVEADELEGLGGALMALLAADAGVEEGELDVGLGSGAGQEVEALEDETDLEAADLGEAVVVECADVGAVKAVEAGGGHVETADDVHEGGFAAAAGAHDGDHFAELDVEVDAAEGANFHVAHFVCFGELDGFDD